MRDLRRFILLFCAFLFLILCVVTAMWKVVTWTRTSLCSNTDAIILVMGNSRIQYGFEDCQIAKTWNVGLNADNYNIIYWKLKMLHRCNPQIEKLILEVDYTTIYHYFSGVEYKLHPYYWDEMDMEDWIGLLNNDRTILMYPFDWQKILYPIKSIFSSVSFSELGIGCYTVLYRDKLQTALEEEKETHARDSHITNDNVVNIVQITYLNKIIDYCDENHILLEFINMPSYPTEGVKHANRLLNQYVKSEYPDIVFHDYELMELPDSCYGDISHINYHGARFMSDILKRDICPW